MAQWINFKELRSRIKFRDVLEAYGVVITIRGDQGTGVCPLPTHKAERRSPSFSANLKRGIWQCFGCGARGNVLDFAVRMDGLTPDNTADIRRTALWLDERFQLGCVGDGPREPPKETRAAPTPDSTTTRSRSPTSPTSKARINEPLDFELKGLDPTHPYLLDRSFLPSTINRFGLGFCSRGLMAERVVIPLHNENGQLVGYAGRVVDDSSITAENPKYRFPSERERTGVKLEFRKSKLVYNMHRIKGPIDHLVVVEGFPSVWWLDQAGYQNVVATMGPSCSPEQAAVIISRASSSTTITVMPVGDGAGERFAQSVFAALGPHRWTRWAKLPDGKRATDLSAEVLSTHIPA